METRAARNHGQALKEKTKTEARIPDVEEWRELAPYQIRHGACTIVKILAIHNNTQRTVTCTSHLLLSLLAIRFQ